MVIRINYRQIITIPFYGTLNLTYRNLYAIFFVNVIHPTEFIKKILIIIQ